MNTPSPETAQAVEPIKDDAKILVDELQTLEALLALTRDRSAKDTDFEPLLGRLRHFFLTDLLEHMAEEDRVFLPAVERLPNGYWKALRLRKEHEELRQFITGFRSTLSLEEHVGPETKRQLLWRLVQETEPILSRLRDHARYEIELTRELHAAANGNGAPS